MQNVDAVEIPEVGLSISSQITTWRICLWTFKMIRITMSWALIFVLLGCARDPSVIRANIPVATQKNRPISIIFLFTTAFIAASGPSQ
jgi:hypothetical protein